MLRTSLTPLARQRKVVRSSLTDHIWRFLPAPYIPYLLELGVDIAEP